MLNCPVVGCNFTCRKARGMSNHRVAKHPPATPYQFVCTVVAVPACNKSFPTKANLAQRVRRIHPAPGVEPRTFLCPIICCGTRSDSLADKKKHLRGPHGLFPCPVPKCEVVLFRSALEMQHHQQTVHGFVALPALLAPPAPVAPVAQMATPAVALPAHAAPVAQMTTPVAPVAQMTTPAPALPAHAAPVAQMATPAPALPVHTAPVAQMTTPVAPVTPNKNKSKLYASKGITPDGQGSGSIEGDEDMADA